jgi:hypothetical protein
VAIVGGFALGAALLWWTWPFLRPQLAPTKGKEVIAVLAEDPRRTERALDLWQQRPRSLLLILVARSLQDPALGQLRARPALVLRLKQVGLIEEGADTVGQLTRLALWARSQPVGSVLLVTGSEHLPRAEAIARILLGAEGVRVSGVAAATGGPREDPLRTLRDHLRAQLWRATGWDGRSMAPAHVRMTLADAAEWPAALPTLVLFGASSLCGEALQAQLPAAISLRCLSRQPPQGLSEGLWRACDLADLSSPALAQAAASLPRGPQLWIGFAHLWLLAPFLAALAEQRPEALSGLQGVVACSSSSVITKRFASNHFDRELVARLAAAQAQLEETCLQLGVPARILAPTLIHGRTAHHSDRNLEVLRGLLRRLPLLPLPAHTGLRQPIAAADLAAVALDQTRRLMGREPVSGLLPLGGDEALSYRELLERIQAGDQRATRCRLLTLPTPVFQLLAAPLLLGSPKAFEAVLRLGADLAGFPTVAALLGREPRPFVVADAP